MLSVEVFTVPALMVSMLSLVVGGEASVMVNLFLLLLRLSLQLVDLTLLFVNFLFYLRCAWQRVNICA